jgi:hypothetical protein
MERATFDLIPVIALRKTEFYLKVKDKLLDALPPEVNREEVDLGLRRAISRLDNMLFISGKERAARSITPGAPVAGLGLNEQELTRRILDAMARD